MATYRQQYLGIKFPFTANNEEGFFLDLNNTYKDKVESEILHVILTPKGTRIRKPDFGTDLTKHIFGINDESEWEEIKKEVIEAVSKYVANVSLNNIEILMDKDDDSTIALKIDYSVTKGKKRENNTIVVNL